jgi:ubiquinone/menaquinone biosynthesis C-methylase UbiE
MVVEPMTDLSSPPSSSGGFRPHPVSWTPEKVARFWDHLATNSATEFFSEKHSVDLARRLIKEAQPLTVVDVGCGTGPLIAEFAHRGLVGIGIDSSQEVLEAARQRTGGLKPEPQFHLGSITALPLPDRSVDAAVLIEVVEHLDDHTLDATLREISRVLRPEGALMVTTPNDEDLAVNSRQCPDCGAEFHVYQHVRAWTETSLSSRLKANGFDSVSVSATRLIENGPRLSRLTRRAIYLIRRQKPRLLAFAKVAPTR